MLLAKILSAMLFVNIFSAMLFLKILSAMLSVKTICKNVRKCLLVGGSDLTDRSRAEQPGQTGAQASDALLKTNLN